MQGLIVTTGSAIMGTMKLNRVLARQNVVFAGLALQVAIFFIFMLVVADFHRRFSSQETLDTPRNRDDSNKIGLGEGVDLNRICLPPSYYCL